MAITDTSLFQSRADITNAMFEQLQNAVPDVYVGEDGIVRILFEVEAAQLENAFLANQLLLEDVFPQTASAPALIMHGQVYGFAFKVGEKAVGTLTFTGDGGTVVTIGTEVGADPGNELELIHFVTTDLGTIPDPGDPPAPTAALNVTAGNLNGTYEYVVTFITASGETLPSDPSNAISPVNQRGDLTGIPIGGPGTTARKIYRQKNGIGDFRLVTTISDNTTTIYTDNIADGSLTSVVPTVDTAHRISVPAIASLVGTDGNVVPGAITTIIDAPAGITDVINNAAFTGGGNPESAEGFRIRLLEYLRNPRSGSPSDLKFWAETVSGVEEATVFTNDNLGTPQNGHATVRISGPAGSIPAGSVVTEVQTVLDAKDLADITIHVATFTQVTLAVTCDVTTDATHTLGDVTPQVQDAISDYINSVAVGGTVYISGIVDAVFGLDGVLDVTVSVPATNQTATATQKFIPGTITVT